MLTRVPTTIESSVTVHRPAEVVADFVLDWAHDHLWRSHVRRFTCTPPGPAVPGQRLIEELRFGGLTFVTPTVVESVTHTAAEHSASYAGRTASIEVSGRRRVVAEAEHRCRVVTTTQLRAAGALRPFTPLLAPSYRRAAAADLLGLPAVLGSVLGSAPGSALGSVRAAEVAR